MNKGKIIKEKIIIIMRGMPSEEIIPVTQALYDGGIRLVEVTFNQSGDLVKTTAAIRTLRAYFGDKICVGAGTVLNIDQLKMAYDAGAEYIISPDAKKEVITETKRFGLLSIPGAMTPTEICFAYDCGADFVKLFPTDILGVPYIRSIRAPLSHIPMLAVGGVDLSTLRSYMDAGMCGVGVGGNILKKEYIEKKEYVKIKESASQYVALLK